MLLLLRAQFSSCCYFVAILTANLLFSLLNSKESERKECVFREFFGKNFFNIFRTCHSDTDGKGWYLSVDEHGKVSAEKVSYSDEPRFHFIVKTIKNCENKEEENDCPSNKESTNGNLRRDKKTKKDFGLPSSEVVWIMHPYQFNGNMSDTISSTPSPPSSSCGISGSSASTGEWTGSGDNSTSV